MWPLEKSQKVIVVAGCLAMAYTQLTLSPATVEFARSLGASKTEFGILGALPIACLFTQLVAAIVVNHCPTRKWLWFWVSIAQRLIFLPVALGPWLLPEVADRTWVWVLIGVTAANHLLTHFGTPLWLSWMGDYLPHAGLNRYWGVRQRWMQGTASLSLLLSAVFIFRSGVEIRTAFPIVIVVGCLLGVMDILLFLRVEEPPVVPLPDPKLWKVLSGPFRSPDFRRFIFFTCFWHLAAMIGAPFISLYLLDYVGIDVFYLLLLWAASWLGGALYAKRMGKLAERYGQRPLLIVCTAAKGLNMVALILVPRHPLVAFWVLVPVFMVDAALNAGIVIANNGYMLKHSPTENRTMFIAASVAFAGLVGGSASIASGASLDALTGWHATWAGLAWTNFHLVFAVSLCLRLVAAVLALGLREADSAPAWDVAEQLIGTTPVRMLRFPLGFYRWKDVERRRRRVGDDARS